MRASLVFLGLFTLVAQAHGRVGDSMRHIEAVYGKPQTVIERHGTFQYLGYGFHGFAIGVQFVNGISKREFFMRLNGSKLSIHHVQEVLALGVAGSGLTWKPLEGPWKNVLHFQQGERYWLRSDLNVFADLLNQNECLMISEMGFKAPKT